MKRFRHFLILVLVIVGFLIGIVWFIYPIVVMEDHSLKEWQENLIGLFAIGGYYAFGVFLWKTHGDRIKRWLERLED